MKRLILSTLLLVLAFAALTAQEALEQDPAVLSGKLANGLSYYIMRNPKPANIAEMRLFINAGSVDEDDDQSGLAHFTEHMAFNGTKHFGKSEMVEYLSSIGMGYYNGLNGMTSWDYTAYTFRIPTDKQEQLRKGLLILADMASQVSFDPAEIERERGVIIEEWRMGQDAGTRVRDAQNAVCFAGSRYAQRSPIGKYEVLSTFKPETLKRFYKDWYRPDMQSVVIVGDFVPADMLALVQEFFGSIPPAVNPRPRQDFFVPDNITPQAVVVTDKEYPRNMLNVMWKKEVQPIQTLEGYYANLKRSLFYTMFNTRLDEHSRKPDPVFSYAGAFEYPMLRTMSTASVFAIFSQGKSEEALTTILTEAERVQRYGFLPTEFERAKLDLKRSAEQVLAEKDTRESENIAWELIDAIANGNVYISPETQNSLILGMVDMISLDEVNAIVTQLIPEKNMFMSIGAPQKEGLSYPVKERLLEIASTINTLKVDPYEDKAVNEPVMAQIPAPLPLREESFNPRSGIRKWVLANGVTVYSKKTDFTNDEVLLSAVSPGGFTQYSPEDVGAATLLSQYIGESGFGPFDAISLQKATVGKVAEATVFVGLNSEGYDASCSPKDLELMFQMIHQYGTNPRFDKQDFDSFIQRTRTWLANRNLEPQNVFADKLTSAIYNDNPYRKSPGEIDLDAITLEQMQRIFTDRFADFSDFTFIIVGNFDEAELKNLACTYLANLPKARRKDRIKDVGIRLVQGRKEIRFQKGATDRCFVSHVTNGAYSYTTANDVNSNALELVLNEKLRENIREERSGVYFIQAWTGKERYPKPAYTLQCLMACAPARVDELNDAIFATLDSVKAGRFAEKYVTTARETMQKTYLENLRSNRYWMNNIQSSIWLDLPLEGFLDKGGLIAKLDKKAIAGAAKKYLNFQKNKLSVIMLPEKPAE